MRVWRRRIESGSCGRWRQWPNGDRRQEGGNDGRSGLRVLFHRVVAKPLENLKLRALNVVLESEGVSHRIPSVLRAPQDQSRHGKAPEWRRIERVLGAGAL